MGLPGMVVSGISIVVGAIMYWAVTAQNSSTVHSHGFRLSTVGVILMIAGGIGFVVSAIVFATSQRKPGIAGHSFDRQTTDEAGKTTETHEKTS